MPDHLQAVIATYQPALELFISRAISRNPSRSQVFSKIKSSKGGGEQKKIVHIYDGIVEIFAPEGAQKDLINVPLTISLPLWFAEEVNLLDIFSGRMGNLNVEINGTHVLITVCGTPGLSKFWGAFVPFIKRQIGEFNMPYNMGIDTEVLLRPKKILQKYC